MANSQKPLNQQVIVVTGATSGIGLATAELAARRGAKLVLTARSTETLKDIVTDINDSGAKAIYVEADVSDRKQVDQVVERALNQYGRIDTWINNAGVSIFGRLDEVDEKDSRRLFDTNFWGVVNGSLAALPHLKTSRGTLINVGSEVSEAVVPLQAMYSASKHAVKGFTDGLRIELEEVDKSPVTITLIQPTAVDTPFPQHAKNYLKKEPKLPGPQIDPEDVAEAILDAALNSQRSVRVGTMAKVNTTVARLIPSLADKLAAKQAGRQQSDKPPKDPDGALFKPSELTSNAGRAHGIRL